MSKFLFILLIIFSGNLFAEKLINKEVSDLNNSEKHMENNDFNYFYDFGRLLGGSSRFWIINTQYNLYLQFDGKDYFKRISFSPTRYGYGSSIISFELTCHEIFKDKRDCNIENIYNAEPKPYPENARVNMGKDFEDIWKENSVNDVLTLNFETQLNFLAHFLKINNFSNEFIEKLLIAAKNKGKKENEGGTSNKEN